MGETPPHHPMDVPEIYYGHSIDRGSQMQMSEVVGTPKRGGQRMTVKMFVLKIPGNSDMKISQRTKTTGNYAGNGLGTTHTSVSGRVRRISILDMHVIIQGKQ